MKKEACEQADMEIVMFNTADAIVTSTGEVDTPPVPVY